MDEIKRMCHFDENRECKKEKYCGDCGFQPADEDKRNGKNPPAVIDWRTEYGVTVPYCPSCGEMAYSAERCFFCGQLLIDNTEAPVRKMRFVGVIERQEGIYCPECGNNLENTSKLYAHIDSLTEYGMGYMCECGHEWRVFFSRAKMEG